MRQRNMPHHRHPCNYYSEVSGQASACPAASLPPPTSTPQTPQISRFTARLLSTRPRPTLAARTRPGTSFDGRGTSPRARTIVPSVPRNGTPKLEGGRGCLSGGGGGFLSVHSSSATASGARIKLASVVAGLSPANSNATTNRHTAAASDAVTGLRSCNPGPHSRNTRPSSAPTSRISRY